MYLSYIRQNFLARFFSTNFLAKFSLSLILCSFIIFFAQNVMAKSVANVVIVADTRGLSGLSLWIAQIYNESHLYLTLLTITIIPITGICLGLFADYILAKIGLDLQHRQVAETKSYSDKGTK